MTYALREDVIRDIASSFRPMRIIDIGCGACGVADIFEQCGHNVEVTDITDRRVPDKWRSKFSKSSAVDVPIKGFDAVILAGLLYHLSSESQMSVCKRLDGVLVFLDSHFVRRCGKGEPRKRTESSEPLPVIPSIEFIRGHLFPGHFVMQTEEHFEDRSWFLCVPKGLARLHLECSYLC